MRRPLPPERLFKIVVIRQGCKQVGGSDGHRVTLRLGKNQVEELVQTNFKKNRNREEKKMKEGRGVDRKDTTAYQE